ncbi:MAG: exosortase A [Gammaproteobacteria bacterium]|nr:exosortase A [Gammaproteobacteria bacterium]
MASAARQALLAAAVLLALAAAYWPTLATIAAIWARSETFAHGYVVLPLAVALVWYRRKALAGLPAAPWWPGLVLVAAAGAGWMLGSLAEVAVVEHWSLYGLLVSATLALLGPALSRALAFPLAFLAFAIPAGEFLVPWLVEQTARFTVFALQVTGVPVHREGNLLMIPSGRWSVVEACSGVRYLIASAMVGTLYAWLRYRSLARRIAFVALSIAMPIVANWLRAYLIVMLAHLTDNRLAVGVDHFIYGWVFFGLVIALTLWIGSRWREAVPAATAPLEAATTVPASNAAMASAAALVLMTGLAWQPLAASLAERAHRAPGALAVIAATGNWTALETPPAGYTPAYHGARSTLHQGFGLDGAPVGLFVALYGDQAPGRELIAWDNQLVAHDETRWRVLGVARETVSWDGRRIGVDAAHLLALDSVQLSLRQWYWIGGRYTANPAVAKAMLALDSLRGEPDHAAVIMIYTPRGDDPGAAAARLDRYSTEFSAVVARSLAAASAATARPE